MMKRNTLIMSLLLLFVAMFATDTFAQRAQIDASDRYRWRFDSRIQFDAAIYNDDKNPLGTNFYNRRLVFRYTGDLGPERAWRARLDMDIAGAEFDMRDFWIRYNHPGTNFYIKYGYFKPYNHQQTNVGHARPRYDFMERAVPQTFGDSRHMGLNFKYYQDQYSGNLGFFTQQPGDPRELGEEKVGLGIYGRITVAPILQDDKWFHLGVGANRRTPDAFSGNTVRFRERAETRVGIGRVYNTGRIPGVDNFVRVNFEANFNYRTILLVGEYNRAMVNRDGFEDLSFHGGYASIMWAITGEGRSYASDDGEPDRLDAPIRSWGALSAGIRYSFLDLNDEDIEGGSGNHITIGLTYYPQRNVWIQWNVGIADLDEFADGDGDYIGGDAFQFLQMRVGAWF